MSKPNAEFTRDILVAATPPLVVFILGMLGNAIDFLTDYIGKEFWISLFLLGIVWAIYYLMRKKIILQGVFFQNEKDHVKLNLPSIQIPKKLLMTLFAIGIVVVCIFLISQVQTFGDDVRFISVKGGSYKVGSDIKEDNNESQLVKIPAFEISKYEVTVLQFKQFVNATGYKTEVENDGGSYVLDEYNESDFVEGVNWQFDERGQRRPEKDFGKYPVIHVSHADADSFCHWKGGRLPTIYEWEIAARAGKDSVEVIFSGSDCAANVAWYKFNSSNRIHEVGKKNANDLGLHDMSGNVWEWCSDLESRSTYRKLAKGGGFVNIGFDIRPQLINEDDFSAEEGYYNVGFRIVMPLSKSSS